MKAKDWQLLSEYLDNQLRAHERNALEKRLSADPELQQALDSLKRTRLVLKHAPAVRAPKNFTLSPKVAEAHRPQPASYPRLKLAMVIASLLFALVFTGDLTQIIPWARPTEAELARQAENVQPAVPGFGMGGGGGGGGFVPAAPLPAEPEVLEIQPLAEAMATATPAPAMKVVGGSAPVPGMLLAEDQAYPAPETSSDNTARVAAESAEAEAEQPTQVPAEGTGGEQSTQVTPEPTNWGRIILRVIEVSLALGAIVLGIIYLYWMRRDW